LIERTPCSDEEAERLGISTLVLFIAVGACCFAVPRLGGWDSKGVGLSHYVLAFCAACVLVAAYLYLAGWGSDEDTDPGDADDVAASAGGKGARKETSTAGVGRAPETGHMACSDDDDDDVEDDVDAAAAVSAAKGDTVLRQRRHGQQQPGSEDPVWDADWANLVMKMRPVVNEQVSSPKAPVEVFELNDTPTWLARMQQRRDQALRAGKQKLVQKIDKEIDNAQRAHAPDPRGVSAGAASATATPRGPSQDPKAPRCATDDVYGMDWSALSAEQTFESEVAPTAPDAA